MYTAYIGQGLHEKGNNQIDVNPLVLYARVLFCRLCSGYIML